MSKKYYEFGLSKEEISALEDLEKIAGRQLKHLEFEEWLRLRGTEKLQYTAGYVVENNHVQIVFIYELSRKLKALPESIGNLSELKVFVINQ